MTDKVKLKETAGSKPAAVSKGTKQQALPPLPRAKRTKKTVPKPCECGCPGMTAGGRFIPGHDSKLKAWTLRVERGVMKITDIEDEGVRNAVKRAMKVGPAPASTKPKLAEAKPKPKAAKSPRKSKPKSNGAESTPKPVDESKVADAPHYDLTEDVGDEDIH